VNFPSSLAGNIGSNDVDYIRYVSLWQLLANLEPPDSYVAADQNQWTRPLQIVAAAVLSAAPNPISRARLIAAAAPSSGAFLQVVPMSSVGTRLDDTTTRIAVAMRLGAPVCLSHSYACGATVDSTGVHGLITVVSLLVVLHAI
jgi:hypothetical protein